MEFPIEEFKDMWLIKNCTQKQVAEYFGCCTSSIQSFAKRNGLFKTQKQISEVRRKNFRKKHGVENPGQLVIVKEKKIETSLKNWGTEYPMQTEEFKARIKKTCLEKYGFEFAAQSEEIKRQKVETCLKNYGVEYGIQSEQGKKKYNETSLKNWGTPYPQQSNKYQEMYNVYARKEYTMPSGHVRKVQGNEPQALDILLKTYNEPQILTDFWDMPFIWYDFNNKRKRYFPDVYIPDDNLIIEVKSKYTYEVALKQNMLKRQATIDAGYKFEFMVIE